MTQPTDQLTVLPSCEAPLLIVREDADFVVVNKPSGLLSVPGRNPANYDSVISRLRLEHPGVHAVHRLDFDTSGILVVPLNKASLSHLSKQFQARTVTKRYIAVVAGLVERDSGRIDRPIAPDLEHRPKSKLSSEGKSAVTDYQVLERDIENNTTLLALFPVTGRSHQLRLHCQALGHPILGCGFYAPLAVQAMAERLLLHAQTLEFIHPGDNSPVVVQAPVPF